MELETQTACIISDEGSPVRQAQVRHRQVQGGFIHRVGGVAKG